MCWKSGLRTTDLAASHILVGGENLGRGFTVNGLTTTYMPRGRGSGVADTIQQRGDSSATSKTITGCAACSLMVRSEVTM